MTSKPAFKPYNQKQKILFPDCLDDYLPADHKARVISNIVDKLDISDIMSSYNKLGSSSYDPRMMIKVLLFSYSEKIFSGRNIARALERDVVYMWLSGKQTPDFRTINNFRSIRLKNFDKFFSSLLMQLEELSLIDLKSYFLDGTIMEANAGKFTYVWSKNSKRYKEGVEKKVRELFGRIEELEKQEDKIYEGKDLPKTDKEISSEKIQEISDKLQEFIDSSNDDDDSGSGGAKDSRKELKKIKKKLDENQQKLYKYEKQLETANGRSSYSKTDTDATFVRMKEDHFKNSHLKPGYNLQFGTENQFIVGYSLHQSPSDKSLLKPHMEKLEKTLWKQPEELIADAGYGSAENYDYLSKKGIEGYVKYPTYQKEKTKKFKEDRFHKENLDYDKRKDEYICPAGKRLQHVDTKKQITTSGYEKTVKIYESEDCNGCELRSLCHKGKRNRRIGIVEKLKYHKRKARDMLDSQRGVELRKRRGIEVESVFGQIKQNFKFRRFNLRGLEKCEIEVGLLAAAHNLNKMVAKIAI